MNIRIMTPELLPLPTSMISSFYIYRDIGFGDTWPIHSLVIMIDNELSSFLLKKWSA